MNRSLDQAQLTRRSGFTLIELMIVIAIIAVVSAVAIPQLQAARVTANEASAVATLRSLASAQAQVAASAAIDSDGDGAGEYGYFAELAGSIPLRVSAPGGPAAGAVGIDELSPASLTSVFARVTNSTVTKSGYVFQLWMAGPTAAGLVSAIGEDANGGKILAPFPDSDNSELFWCAYAWPMSLGETGRSTFFISNDGTTLSYNNNGAVQYSGVAAGPAFDAAYSIPGDMSSSSAVGIPGADGNAWVILN
jgi:prepilin-type N-terminal cleavage/methylation domain-containing protein